jgi:muramidase (phage lysozyme)
MMMSITIKHDLDAGAGASFNPLGSSGWDLPHINSGKDLPDERTDVSPAQSFQDYLADLVPSINDSINDARLNTVPKSEMPATVSELIRPTRGGAVAGLLDVIAQGEGTAGQNLVKHGYSSGYDVTLGYGAFDPHRSKPISQMTLAEVKKFQQGMLSHPKNKWNSSAVGRYQIVGKTLRAIQKEMGLSDSTLFNQETQDAMAMHLLQKQGYDKWQVGTMSDRAFQVNLAKEWASVVDPRTGRSHYNQKVGTSTAQIQNALQNIKAPSSAVALNFLSQRGSKDTTLATNGSARYSYWLDELNNL